MDSDDYLSRILPHRLDALAIAELLLKFRLKWREPKPMQIYVDGRLQFEGRTTMFTNPALEVGVLHARALLEFLGLKVFEGALVQATSSSRRRDDAAVELMNGPSGPLQTVTLEQAGAIHPTDPIAARNALAKIIVAGHKGLAHSSATYFAAPAEAEDILLALNITQQLVEKYVYLPLGRQRPPIPIEARPRSDA
jgi:hypothetical protein